MGITEIERGNIMSNLENFIKLITGNFDNKEQFENFQKNGNQDYPYCEHVNTVCNGKIKNLPSDFKGIFLVEESYYTVKGHTHGSSHLFLFTTEGDDVKLTSYDIPEGYNKADFSYAKMKEVNYEDLKPSEKFNPAIFKLKDGVWKGGSESMFSPVLKFKLNEEFSEEKLVVSETMEMNGKRTFGYDDPIIYKRK